MHRDPRDLGPAARAGLTVPEYKRRVWDMARHLVHPTFFYVVIQVVGLTRLSGHAAFGHSGWWEGGLFAASFLGAWAVFYSTLLRDAGLASLTVTVLVPLSLLGLVIPWLALPAVQAMTDAQLLVAAAALAGPGPIAWAFTLRRWRAAKREAAPLLPTHEEGQP